MKSVFKTLAILLSVCFFAAAQDYMNPVPDSRFKVDLLVVVAHPDDETELGAYLARAILDEHKRVAIVFGTRGNTGGNAEGQEQATSLGLIREIEARRAVAHFDISDVWFLRGLDTPGQRVLDSLEIWNHGDSLDRLVRIVRLTRPDVIATWLPDWVAGENHGDHQAAGVLATEAFDLAGNAAAFSEQLAVPINRFDISNLTEGLHPWQAQKIYYVTDAAHTEFLKGKGPEYSSTDISSSRHVSYAHLAAEECSYHLTQDDTGQMAKKALEKNDLHYFNEPVRFIFGKSYVPSSTTGDLFEGVSQDPIPYHAPPGYVPRSASEPRIELGGSWHFYREFWQAHDLEHLKNLLGPEVMAQFDSRFNFPFLIENPSDTPMQLKITATIPEGWSFIQQPPDSLTVPPHRTYFYVLYTRTAKSQKGWKNVEVKAELQQKSLNEISIRAELDAAAMPE